MIADAFAYLSKKQVEAVDAVVAQPTLKNNLKSVGLAVATGVLEGATVLGGTLLLIAVASTVAAPFTKKSDEITE